MGTDWGERGPPIQRGYVEQFLQEFAADIHGHCLEFQEDAYTSRFGGSRVTTIDILHKDGGNPKATLVADLTHANNIPNNMFDCIICTYVLHAVFECDRMVSELYRILRPHGVLLVAVPDITISYPQYDEYWRFTAAGLHRLLTNVFGIGRVTVRSYGNSLIAVGELRGLLAVDFTAAELAYHDPRYALVVCARAFK